MVFDVPLANVRGDPNTRVGCPAKRVRGRKRLDFLSHRIVLCLFAWLLPAVLFGDTGDPPGRVARLSYLHGAVSLQPSGENQWSEASTNYVVTTGDRLYTDVDSRAELEVGPFAVRMSQTTDLTIVNLNDQVMQLGLNQGSIRVTVFTLPPNNSVEIDAPNGTLNVLQPGFYRVDTDPNTGSTLVSVNSGSVQVSSGGVSQTVHGGEAVQLTGTGAVQMVALPNQDDFDQWCASRDRRIRSFASAQYVNPYLPGVEDLDAYGRWQVVAEYGPVWYPAGVPVGWVPYRFGHWVWVEPWGWTWVEDEAWGFCAFHFGRWALIGAVWGWIPGPVAVLPFYAPGLVAFLGGGGFSIGIGVQAWFPLGPGEPFFPWYHYGRDYLRVVNVTNIRNVTNIENIINVRDINQIQYRYKTVATTAVPTEVFRSGQPVAQHVVRVAPQQLARAQVAPHPRVTPAPTAAFGGRRPAPVPLAHGATGPRVPGAARARPVPSAGRPAGESGLRTGRNPPVERTPLAGRPPIAAPHFVTRLPPPVHSVPFSEREPALALHPGRPLEPQQRLNLMQGRPAGIMRDSEFPPHPPEWRSPPAVRPQAVRPEARPAPRKP